MLTVNAKTFDYVCMVYIQFVINGLSIYTLYLVFPWLLEEGRISTLTYVLYNVYYIFLITNIHGNMVMIMKTNTSTIGRVLPAVPPPGWQYCEFCESNAPPRSFHCHICRRCILKRDHHCVFTGKCIGYFTYRYYFCLITYSALCCFFITVTGFPYIWNILGEVSIQTILSYLLPIAMYWFGFLGFLNSILALMAFLATAFWIFMSVLVVWQSKHVHHNMTTYERNRDIYKYDLGVNENLAQIFGKRWKIAWMFPLISSPLPGDGLTFETADTFEDPKKL